MPKMQNYIDESEKLIQPKCLLCMQSKILTKKILTGKLGIVSSWLLYFKVQQLDRILLYSN